jgi:hypothetical protein
VSTGKYLSGTTFLTFSVIAKRCKKFANTALVLFQNCVMVTKLPTAIRQHPGLVLLQNRAMLRETIWKRTDRLYFLSNIL